MVVFQPDPLRLSRQPWRPVSSHLRVLFSPGWAPDTALGNDVPGMMLNSEGWDLVDKRSTFSPLRWDDFEA